MKLTVEQKNKLERLRKLKIIEGEENIINNPRRALVVAYKHGAIESWSDNGQFYVVRFAKDKPIRLRTYQVGEFIADRLLSMKDPLDETIEEEATEEPVEEKEEDNSERESEKDSVEEAGTKPYAELTVSELKDLCKELGISGYSNMRRGELIEALLTQNSI